MTKEGLGSDTGIIQVHSNHISQTEAQDDS